MSLILTFEVVYYNVILIWTIKNSMNTRKDKFNQKRSCYKINLIQKLDNVCFDND